MVKEANGAAARRLPPSLIFSCYTSSHETLYRDHFLPSLPPGLQSRSTRLDITGTGDFQSRDFLQSIEAKLELMIESIRANTGRAIVWSDVDIIFTRDPTELFAQMLEQEDVDIWYQKEHIDYSDDVNAGLVLMRCNSTVERFYRDVLATMRSVPGLNDQNAINRLLSEGAAVSWSYLPRQFYARSQGWPPPRDIVAYHANVTPGSGGVTQKIRQFRDLRLLLKYGAPYARYVRLRNKTMHSVTKRLGPRL